ncbi:MAG: phosphopantothenoylcysteine decarboxylase [Candidatus Altiarchaeota archaeon]
MRILVTAGPTQEPVDSVRFITNASTGKMGFAVASRALSRGHDVCVVFGPTHVPPLEGVKAIGVRTAEEMTEACLGELESGYDAFVCAAAIADYTPASVEKGKIKSGREMTLTLKPTRKLTKASREKFRDLVIVGFKAEYDVSEDELIESARKKLVGDSLNVIVANDIGKHVFGSNDTEVFFVGEAGLLERMEGSKGDIAERIVSIIEGLK